MDLTALPTDWKSASLERISAFITKGSTPTTYGFKWESSGILFLRSECVAEEGLDLSEAMFISPKAHAVLRRSEIKDGDILMTITGNVGRVIVLSGVGEANMNQHVARIRVVADDADARYVHHFLSQPKLRTYYSSITTGQAYPQISLRQVRDTKIPLPKVEEQRGIAAALGDVDALIGALDKLIAKKRGLKQGAMQQLLTGQTRLPGFSGAWDVKTIAELEKLGSVKLSRGQVISKNDISDIPGAYPIYSSSVHNDGLFGRYGEFMFDEELITWSIDGGGHFFHRPKHKFSVTNVCGFMCVDTSQISYRFLAAELQLLHTRKRFDYQSKAHPSIVRKEYEVHLPPLPEQAAIATALSDIDAELAALEARRDKTRALKQGMMQELLTGRIRLLAG